MKIFKLILFTSIAFSQTIEISVDKNKIEEGESLTLSIEVNGGKDFAKVDLAPLGKSFDIISGPSQQTTIQFINGIMENKKILSWILLPKITGKIIIPSLSVRVGENTFRSKEIIVNVGKVKDISSSSVFIVGEIDKDSIYLGEQITLTYMLYKKSDINITDIEQFQMPDFKGFWTEEIYTPKRLQYQSKEVNLKGVNYQVANLGQRALFPIASKIHEIPSVRVKVQIETKKKKRRSDPFFDPFFSSFFAETKSKIIVSQKKIVNIIAFPEPRPYDFTGAVGDFKIISSIDRREAKVNDGITFRVYLEGTGNIGLFSLPDLKFPENIEVFPPTNDFEKNGFRNQLTGKEKWEYILIPRKEGAYTIPKLEMSFFDPKSQSWKRISTDNINLNISQGKTEISTNNSFTKREIELLKEDIRYIRTGDIILFNSNQSKNNYTIFIYLLSIIIFSSPYLISNILGYRNSTAYNRKMQNALKINLKLLNHKDGENAFKKASNVCYLYLRDKLNLSTKYLDPLSVKEILDGKIETNISDKLNRLLVICDEGKYAPNALEKEKTILKEMKEILKLVDREIK